MSGLMKNELGVPKIVDRATFQAELDALRVREKAHTREGDAIAAARRRLPMVEGDGATPLIGDRGAGTLWGARGGCGRRLTQERAPPWRRPAEDSPWSRWMAPLRSLATVAR